MVHYVYGGGLSGCMYDYGPEVAETKEQAIDALVWLYGGDGTFEEPTLEDGEEATMREALARDGIYYFNRPAAVGAHYCEVSEANGPCPEGS